MLAKKMDDMTVAFTTLSVEFKEHRARDLELSKLRELTCPQDERLGHIELAQRETQSDVDAIAGLVREHVSEHEKSKQAAVEAKRFWTRSTASEVLRMAAAVTVALITTKLLGL